MPRTWLEFALGGVVLSLAMPATLIVAASLIWAAWMQRSSLVTLWKPYHWLFLTHLFFLFGVSAVGAFYPAPLPLPVDWHPNRTAELYLDVLWYASLSSSVFWIWRMKGFRCFATSLMVLMECTVYGALFVAGMSVSGDWI